MNKAAFDSYNEQYKPVAIPAWVAIRMLKVLEKYEKEEPSKEYKKILTGLMVVIAEAYARYEKEKYE